ncbi:antibiotic biosynthesis monooxygenase [Aeromicrobium sp. IC_218]|uniref:antibiotic biosynthesis monooxygenase family protein n=1 Tax=Aeromicrobium sp. IC_218 TaxID=2545468 RepID=UPI001039B1B8|nr:antibiotic biosynthesis monooxygenase [Aeromicrobium sp. IC_218]TCI98796.1 antibiotic biosynthesis monooxygenase [Aeromicrobium sp. IC_218]
MSIVKINAITVPADSGDELAHRFAARGDSMDGTPGFEGFELLKPTDDRHVWLVVTRWADEESFQAWTASESFGRSHGHGGADAGAHGGGTDENGEGHRRKPVGTGAELWSYETALDRRA